MPDVNSRQGLVLPLELIWIPPPASPKRGVRPTRCPLPSERDDEGAGRDRHWRSCPEEDDAAARLAPALARVKVAEGARAAMPEARQALVTPPRTRAPPVAVATIPLVVALAWERAAGRPDAALR